MTGALTGPTIGGMPSTKKKALLSASKPLLLARRLPPTNPVRAARRALQRRKDPHPHREQNRLAYAGMTPAEKVERTWRKAARPPIPRNADRNTPRGRRKFALAHAYREWSDDEEVFRIYMSAAVMRELTGGNYSVDHRVPLVSHLVCGLHCHTNLRVVSGEENTLKGSSFWPQMPNYGWETVDFLLNS